MDELISVEDAWDMVHRSGVDVNKATTFKNWRFRNGIDVVYAVKRSEVEAALRRLGLDPVAPRG